MLRLKLLSKKPKYKSMNASNNDNIVFQFVIERPKKLHTITSHPETVLLRRSSSDVIEFVSIFEQLIGKLKTPISTPECQKPNNELKKAQAIANSIKNLEYLE